MANMEHLALLMQGVEVWNQWRNEHESIVPDLSGANLSGVDLSGADLSGANLSGADLSGADLNGADLNGADLSGVDLSKVDPSEANLSEAMPGEWDLSKVDDPIATAGSIPAEPGSLPDWDDCKPESGAEDHNIAPSATTPPEDTWWTNEDADDKTTFGAAPSTDTVQFTAYYPRETQANTRYLFLLYAHTEEAFEKVADDIEKFRDELGNIVPPPKTAKQTTQISLNTPITVVPECDQIEFDPPSLTKKWGGEWTRFGFDFRPTQAMSGDTLFVRVSIQIATVEVAHINSAVEVIEEKAGSDQHIDEMENPLAEAKLNSSTSELYQSIFISYSRKDKNVVKVYKLVQEAVGNIAFMDTYNIRAGEDWRSALALAIDKADIFQLFWSDNSAGSPNVRDEWEYALEHKCPENRCVGFIRPVCWNDPIKPLPPQELGHLNFKYVPLDDLVTS
jgi:hypothetical protein